MQEVNGLAYEAVGEGEPVLLIHGSLIADAFVPFTAQPVLTESFRLIRYRRRGFAGGQPPASSSGLAAQVHDARMLLEHLGVEWAHVVGHSFGGLVATQLALDEPALVQTLVLLEPGLFTRAEARAFFESFSPLQELHRAGDSATAADLFLSNGGQVDWRAELAETVPGGAEQAIADAATLFEVDIPAGQGRTFDADGERLPMPVLHVSGAESSFPNRRAVIETTAPHLEDVEIADVHHGLQMVRPAAVADAIAAFLLRHRFA